MYRIQTCNVEGKTVVALETPSLPEAEYVAEYQEKINGWARVQVYCPTHGWTRVLVDQCVDCFDDAVDDWYGRGAC